MHLVTHFVLTFMSKKTDDVCIAKQLERAVLAYKVGQHLVIDYAELPMLGKTAAFVCLPSSHDWYIVVQCLNTVKYDALFHSYVAQFCDPEKFGVLSFSELTDFHPVSLLFQKIYEVILFTRSVYSTMLCLGCE